MSHAIYIHLLGPIRIDGAVGQPPTDRSHALLELAAWMSLQSDGAYGCQIDRDLVWSASTRLSAMSRLRGWLGPVALPPVRRGHPYRLHAVTDWDLAVAPILDRKGQLRTGVTTDALLTALSYIRGVPLADVAAPWADAPRLTMVLTLRAVAASLLARPEVRGALRLKVQSLSGRLMPPDRITGNGHAA